jgi:hypothetical protein
MIADRAGGVNAAHTRTGVNTLVAHAGQCYRAVGVDGAFWLAFHIGIALQAGQAGAGSRAIAIPTLGVDATW